MPTERRLKRGYMSYCRKTCNQDGNEFGVDVSQSLITITQSFENSPCWRVNYGPKDYVGRRGGDLIVDVDAADARVTQILHGQ